MNAYDQGGGFTESQGAPGSQREKRNNSIRPVTIKQINEASEPNPDDDTQIDGEPVGRLAIVGCIRNVTNAAANSVIYKIEDGTGNLEVKKWPDTRTSGGNNEDGAEDEDMSGGGDDEQKKKNEFQVGQYVWVLGNCRLFNGKRSVTVTTIRPITDFNEVIYHHTKALAVHLLLTKGPSSGTNGHSNGGVSAGAGGDNLFMENSMGNKIQSDILKILQDGNQETGTHVEVVANKLGKDTSTVMRELEDMEQTGVTYQADENHYLPIG